MAFQVAYTLAYSWLLSFSAAIGNDNNMIQDTKHFNTSFIYINQQSFNLYFFIHTTFFLIIQPMQLTVLMLYTIFFMSYGAFTRALR